MGDLPFEKASFDLIWSEGSAFIMGLAAAFRDWKRFLAPDGHLVVSDCTWFSDAPPPECREFFEAVCPDMMTEADTEAAIRENGYSRIGSFRLPDEGWWDHYYTPLSRNHPVLKETLAGNPDARMIIRGLEQEMEMHRTYANEYGYTFFVLQNRPAG